MVDVAAALILDAEGRFMICQRPAHKGRGLLWEFVGGKAEPGETLPETLIRECREELDITVNVLDVYTQLVHEYPDITIRLTLFNCTVASGEPKLLEHNDLKWIHPREIPQYEFCPADKDILKMLMEDHP